MKLVFDKLDKRDLDKYRVARKQQAVYRAAAKLFAEGVAWPTALAIVQEAFDTVTAQE